MPVGGGAGSGDGKDGAMRNIGQSVGNISMLVSSMTMGTNGIEHQNHNQDEDAPMMNSEQDEFVLETKLKIIEILHVSFYFL